MSTISELGRVVSIHRHPVKSMGGESPDAVDVTDRGVVGDRAYALVDAETGKVASAKNPRRWPGLFAFRAGFVGPPGPEMDAIPAVRFVLPDGSTATSDDPDVDARLGEAVGRPVRLARQGLPGAGAEGLDTTSDETFDYTFPPGTLFDGAFIHLLTTASLRHFGALAPSSRFEPARFRPNFVIEAANGAVGLVEQGWIGRVIRIGEAVLQVERPCPRCVMTTLPQGDLPRDPAILRTIAREAGGDLGVYATVLQGARVAVGDAVTLA